MVGVALTLATYSNKAVAIGAVSFYVDHFVTGRITQFTYGTAGKTPYQPLNPEHIIREHKSFLDPAGNKRIPGRFKTMLPRVCYPLAFIDPPERFRRIAGD